MSSSILRKRHHAKRFEGKDDIAFVFIECNLKTEHSDHCKWDCTIRRVCLAKTPDPSRPCEKIPNHNEPCKNTCLEIGVKADKYGPSFENILRKAEEKKELHRRILEL
jgi:hypothetical protein